MASASLRPRRIRLRSVFSRTSVRESAALIAMLGLIAGVTLAGQDAGSAATPVAQSNGTFLSGSVVGSPLSDLVSLVPAAVTNTGGAAAVDNHPLSVSALNALDVSLGNGVNLLGGSGILRLGAVAQYAQAAPDGSSKAASGALTDSGAIAVDGSDQFPSDATLSLKKLIGTGLAGALADVSLTTGALSASATQTASGTQTGDYWIAGLELDVTSPLVSGVTSGLRTTLAGLQPVVDGLPALIKALPGVGPLATVTGVPTLVNIVDELGDITSADGSIKANLTTGAVSIDVAAALKTLGLDLNKLAPGTELLPYISTALTKQLLPAITSALTGLTQKLTAAVNGISVSVLGVPVATSVLAPVLNPVIAQLTAPVSTVVAGLGTVVITPLADALTQLLSLQANVQEKADGRFTERALQVGLLPEATTPLAVVDLASATVGPNAGPAAPVVPTATGLSPDHGPVAGGQTVTVTGSGLVPDSTTVTIGGNSVPATVTSATTLTFTTPAHAVGDVPVTVTTPTGTSAPALTYTYDPAAAVVPTISGLSPDHGPAAGGDTVTVTGTGFVAGSTSVTIGGATVPAGSVTVTSSTELTFPTPAHIPGGVMVTVTTPGGTSTPTLTYTYEPAASVAPTATGLAPTHGPASGGTAVTITGTGFVPGSTSVTIGGISVPAVVTSSTSLILVTPAHAAGDVTVTVSTPGGTSTPALTYTYDPAVPVLPTASGLSPDHGPAAGGQTVTVTGTGFVPGSTIVTIGGTVIPTGSVTVTSPTSLTFPTPAHAAGDVAVTVATLGGTTSPALTYTYDPAAAVAPTASGLTPNHGPVAGGQTVTITGAGFVPGSTSVTVGGVQVPASRVTVVSPTRLLLVTPKHAAGPVRVTVTTRGGTSAPLAYTYDAVSNTLPPTITDPTDGSTTADPTPVIRGTGTPGNRITVTEGGRTLCTTTVRDDGTWSCQSGTLASGDHRIVTTETTPAGGAVGRTGSNFDVNADTTSRNDNGLATTGLAIASMTVLSLVIAAAGVLLLFVGRRRRES